MADCLPARKGFCPSRPCRARRSRTAATSIDINTADVRALDTLPGIGEVLAGRIVEYREAHGPFPSVEALDHVEGIGWGTLAPIRRFLIAG